MTLHRRHPWVTWYIAIVVTISAAIHVVEVWV